MFYQRNQQNCDPDHMYYLERELEEAREREERRINEADRQREERMREYRERSEANSRSASTWPEALHKQAYLFRCEANDWPAGDPDFPIEPDDYFTPGAEACKRALEIWNEVAASRQNAIEALEDQIQIIKNGIRQEVSEKLLAEGADKPAGWKSVASAIAEIDEDEVGSWLYW